MQTYRNFVAEVMADSIIRYKIGGKPHSHRLTTLRVVFPRIVLAEFNTHRLLSRNSASSRARPIEKMIDDVLTNAFIPDRYPRKHKGMQAPDDAWVTDDMPEYDLWNAHWLEARNSAVWFVKRMADLEISKQLVNRLIEPFMMHQVIVSATEWENFIGLRAHRDAQNEIQICANLILNEMNQSTPRELIYGGWHLPFDGQLDREELEQLFKKIQREPNPVADSVDEVARMIMVARCARISYNSFEGPRDIEKDVAMFMQLKKSGHFSPFEHVARAMTPSEYIRYTQTSPKGIEYGWCGNFRGFIQTRRMFERNEENRIDSRLLKK